VTIEPAPTSPIPLVAPRQVNITTWRGAVFTFFFINGFVMGTWASRIPAVASSFDLSPGQWGFLVTSMPVGAVVGMLLSSHILERFGERRTAIATQTIMASGISLAGVAATLLPTQVYLGAIGLIILGFGMSTTNIVINLEAASVDRVSGRTRMPMFHGTWSIGAAVGAAVGAVVTGASIPVGVHFPVVAGAVLVLSIIAVRFFPQLRDAHTDRPNPTFGERMRVWVEPRTLLVGVIVLAAQFNEGTANNWLSYAMVHGRSWKEEQGALLVTVFAVFMMVGRFAGGWVVDRIGRALALRFAFASAGIGVLLVVFLDSPIGVVVGVSLWGLGASLGYPLGISAAADDPHNAPARVAAVATVATIAGLVGPTAIGLAAEGLGFPHAFIIVAALVVVGAVIAGAARPPVAARR
jgi:MFS family permease